MNKYPITNLAERLEQANHHRDYSLYNHLLRSVPADIKEQVRAEVTRLARERMAGQSKG